MIRLLSLSLAVVSFATGAFFAAICIWLVFAVLFGQGQALLYAGLPLVMAGFIAAFFFLAGNACLMTARAGKSPQANEGDTFK